MCRSTNPTVKKTNTYTNQRTSVLMIFTKLTGAQAAEQAARAMGWGWVFRTKQDLGDAHLHGMIIKASVPMRSPAENSEMFGECPVWGHIHSCRKVGPLWQVLPLPGTWRGDLGRSWDLGLSKEPRVLPPLPIRASACRKDRKASPENCIPLLQREVNNS